MFALVDCNNFYCSVERAFDPMLKRKPMVVLSNNDGCAIARSNEAKDLGIKMGDPWHLINKRPELRPVIALSSNYTNYADASRRVYQVLWWFSPLVEPYSIDEMFLDLTGMPGDLAALAREIRATVLRHTWIPTCIGIGPTKTIAKLANKLAKQDRAGPGVCDLSTPAARAAAYATAPLADVWGIGPQSLKKLAGQGVATVADFVAMPADAVRKLLTVTGQRTHAELCGICCIPFSEMPATRKSIATTKSFGRPVTTWADMRDAVATYADTAAGKLRRFKLLAGAMQVFVTTSEFTNNPRYASSTTFGIEPTADSRDLITAATRAAHGLWRDGFRYAKAGVILVDLYRPASLPIADLFASRDPDTSARLMGAVDGLNGRFGRGTVRPGCYSLAPSWGTRRANLSPCYTTRLDDLMPVRS